MQVASDIDADEFVVEISLDEEEFGIVQEGPSGPELTIYNRAERDHWSFPAEELREVIARATAKLTGTANE